MTTPNPEPLADSRLHQATGQMDRALAALADEGGFGPGDEGAWVSDSALDAVYAALDAARALVGQEIAARATSAAG